METTDTRAWLDARMTELRRKYAECATMPDGTRISLGELRRLMRAVRMEHEEPREDAHGRA